MSLLSESKSVVAQCVELVTGQLTAAEILQGQGHVHVASAVYDFAVDGGGISTKTLALSEVIPAGAIFVGVVVDVINTLTTAANAQVALLINGSTIVAATPVANSPFNGPAQYSTANIRKLAGQATSLSMAISVGALTAGRVIYGVSYIL